MNDSVSDALIRIKNGYLASRQEVEVRYSKLVLNLCKLLKQEGYIEEFREKNNQIAVSLKYENKTPALSDIKRVSKPGLRVYKGVREIPKVLNGLGIAIVSTPKGLMTDKQARKLGIGGEVMAYVW